MRFTRLFLILAARAAGSLDWLGLARSPRRRSLFLILRLTIILCLVLSLAGLEIVQRGDNLAVVFLLDVSDSMPQEAIAAEVEYVRSALDAMSPDDQAALILFGGDALVERAMSPVRELSEITSIPVTNQTNLAEAMQLGLALFPSGYARRMVILSDGAQTSGDALEAAQFEPPPMWRSWSCPSSRRERQKHGSRIWMSPRIYGQARSLTSMSRSKQLNRRGQSCASSAEMKFSTSKPTTCGAGCNP
jgi:hypothetical protein